MDQVLTPIPIDIEPFRCGRVFSIKGERFEVWKFSLCEEVLQVVESDKLAVPGIDAAVIELELVAIRSWRLPALLDIEPVNLDPLWTDSQLRIGDQAFGLVAHDFWGERTKLRLMRAYWKDAEVPHA